jgi:hypothetical protein
MTKKTYEHPSGVHFSYEVDKSGALVGIVTISRAGHVATQECVFAPAEALRAFALVQKYETIAVDCEDGQSGPLLMPTHPRWNEFVALLKESRKANEGCDPDECVVSLDINRHARWVLTAHFPEVDVEGTLGFFIESDCLSTDEVLACIAEPWAELNEKA